MPAASGETWVGVGAVSASMRIVRKLLPEAVKLVRPYQVHLA
jgi:hypothetical protein